MRNLHSASKIHPFPSASQKDDNSDILAKPTNYWHTLISMMNVIMKLRNRLQFRYRLERFWPKFVPMEGGPGVYADRGIRLGVSANPHVYRRLIHFLAKVLDKENSFIDCGANFGWISISVAAELNHRGGGGRVLAIEANPTTAAMLSKSVRRNRLGERIILAQTFVGENEGVTDFYNCTATETSSAYFSDHIKDAVEKYSGRVKVQKIPSSSVDSLCETYKLRNVGAIKIDVEGAELFVLKGSQKLIAQSPEPAFIVEMNPTTARAAGYSIRDIWDFFTTKGFHIFEFAAESSDYRLVPSLSFDEDHLWQAGDIVAVKNPEFLHQKLGGSLSWD